MRPIPHPLPTRLPKVVQPSNKKDPQINRAMGRHPRIVLAIPVEFGGAPSAGGINKVPTQGIPTGCYAVILPSSVRPSVLNKPV